jgi:predicted ATPase
MPHPPTAPDEYAPGNPRWNGSGRLVVLSGCSGGGKSTLLAALAARGHATFPEPGRQVVQEERLIDGPALPWVDPVRFAERCLVRAAFFFDMADATRGPVFFDRGIVDAITHLERLGGAPPHAVEAVRRYRYGRVFLVPPGRPCSPATPSGATASVRQLRNTTRWW